MATAIDIQADREELYRAIREKRRPDPDVARRVRERAEAVKEDIRKSGITDLAVPLIREAREE